MWKPAQAKIATLLCLLAACGAERDGASTGARAAASAQAEHAETSRAAAPAEPDPEQARARALDARFPLHGLITGTQLKVHASPDPDSTVIGWLRVGSRVRLAGEPTKTSTCATGWHGIHPRGFVCAGLGVEVSESPRESALAVNPPAKDDALPYRYYFVKEPKVPEYHRLPTRDDQRRARTFVDRYLEIAERDERRAAKFLSGELVEEAAPATRVVRRYLDRGFFVAGAGIEERDARKFVRTVRSSYVQLAQLEERTGSSFRGVELGAERTLPVAWAVRDAKPFVVRHRDDGSLAFIANEEEAPIERHTILPWVGRERIDTRVLHKLDDGRYLKHWFVAVAERIRRPSAIGADEPWVHVNLEQQTLVLYQGDEPVYATLVSSGLEGHETPAGLFEIRQKYVANGMSDLGPEAGDDRYSIDDVPWTQYFDGSIALHGAFWHERFGLQRSHGCVNLAPHDAHRVFDHTWPPLDPGWHGVSAEAAGLKASKVYVTKE